MDESALEHLFVVPDFEDVASVSGGNRFNAGLIGALRARGARVAVRTERVPIEAWPPARWTWLDSLYFERFSSWLGCPAAGKRGLLLHALPSQLRAAARGEPVPPGPSKSEAALLTGFDRVMVPSEHFAAQLSSLRELDGALFVVEPGLGIDARLAPDRRGSSAPRGTLLSACSVAHLVANKGLLEFLRALAQLVMPTSPRLSVIGRTDLEPSHAQVVRSLIASTPLRNVVELRGALPPEQTLERVHGSDLFLSTSPFESYGMAIAEARALGVPVLARAGGNVEQLVEQGSGGQVCADASALARAFAALSADPVELERRRACAREHALLPRPYDLVASDFLRGAG